MQQDIEIQRMKILFDLEFSFKVNKQLLLVAEQKNAAQDQFLATVFNVKRVCEDVSECVMKLSTETYCLRNGEKMEESMRIVCQERSKTVKTLLNRLIDSAGNVRLPTQHRIDDTWESGVAQCRELAKGISNASIELHQIFDSFEESLKNDTVGQSIEHLKEIRKHQNYLFSQSNSFPALHNKDHRWEIYEEYLKKYEKGNGRIGLN